jgi:hypothetical protein
MYVYPFDVSMSGLLVLAEYAGQVNELTVDGWEDVMDDVITATQMFTPLGAGTVDDAKLQQAGGSKITLLLELNNLSPQQANKCHELVGVTKKIELGGDRPSAFMTFLPDAVMPQAQAGQVRLFATELPTEYIFKNDVILSAKRCFEAVVGDLEQQRGGSQKERSSISQRKKRLRKAVDQLASMVGDAAAGPPVFRSHRAVLGDDAGSWKSFEAWVVERPQAMIGKLHPTSMRDYVFSDTLRLVAMQLQYYVYFARPLEGAEPRAATIQESKTKAKKSNTSTSLLFSGQFRAKPATIYGDKRAIIWVIDHNLLSYLVNDAPMSTFKQLMRYGTEHCIMSDNKGMRITIHPRLEQLNVLDPNNEITQSRLHDDGGQRVMTLTGETLQEYAFLYTAMRRVATSLPQTPAALETATPASGEESMETATPASGSDAMETATPASAEESSDQSYHVAKKWIGNQMPESDDERRLLLFLLGTQSCRRAEFKEFILAKCKWTPTEGQCDLMVGLNSNCAVISQIAGAGKSEFLVAAAAWMEEMAKKAQEEAVVGEGHLGAVASSTHEKPTFFVCSPSNLQTDDLEAKFKNVFGHAAVQRMGIDGDGQWPRDYFDDLLTGAMTNARESIGFRVLVLADRVIDMLIDIHEVASRFHDSDDDKRAIVAVEALTKYLLRARHQHLQGIWDGLEQAQRDAVKEKTVFIGTSAQILKLFSGISEHAHYFEDLFNMRILMADEIQLESAFTLFALCLSVKFYLGCCDPRQAPNAHQNLNFNTLFDQNQGGPSAVIAIVRHSCFRWCSY